MYLFYGDSHKLEFENTIHDKSSSKGCDLHVNMHVNVVVKLTT